MTITIKRPTQDTVAITLTCSLDDYAAVFGYAFTREFAEVAVPALQKAEVTTEES